MEPRKAEYRTGLVPDMDALRREAELQQVLEALCEQEALGGRETPTAQWSDWWYRFSFVIYHLAYCLALPLCAALDGIVAGVLDAWTQAHTGELPDWVNEV